MFSWPPRSRWLIIGPFINTASQYPPPCSFNSLLLFSLIAPYQHLPLPVSEVTKAFLQVQKRPHSLIHDSPPVSTYTIWIWNSARRKSSDTGHTKWEGGRQGMWSHLIVESLYSEWWQSALWLCGVCWALRLKPYTGKAPWWPWLVKCSHFHQEGASVQRPLRAGRLLLEGQPQKAFGGDLCFLTFIAEARLRNCITHRKTTNLYANVYYKIQTVQPAAQRIWTYSRALRWMLTCSHW